MSVWLSHCYLSILQQLESHTDFSARSSTPYIHNTHNAYPNRQLATLDGEMSAVETAKADEGAQVLIKPKHDLSIEEFEEARIK